MVGVLEKVPPRRPWSLWIRERVGLCSGVFRIEGLATRSLRVSTVISRSIGSIVGRFVGGEIGSSVLSEAEGEGGDIGIFAGEA